MSYNKFALLAQSVVGDNYSTKNGRDGDQTGFELNCRKFYELSGIPWVKCIRFNNSELANNFADMMVDLVMNPCIGYDTSQRNSLYNSMESAPGHDPIFLDHDCECDCSSLIYVALKYLTGIVWDKANDPDYDNTTLPKVRNINFYCAQQAFTELGGITLYTDAAHLTTGENLERGDILLTDIVTGGHSAVFV